MLLFVGGHHLQQQERLFASGCLVLKEEEKKGAGGNIWVKPRRVLLPLFCQMDSMSMFFNEYPSSDSTVTGIVTLLATAKALWNLQETIESQADAKDIMFTFLQGVIPRLMMMVLK